MRDRRQVALCSITSSTHLVFSELPVLFRAVLCPLSAFVHLLTLKRVVCVFFLLLLDRALIFSRTSCPYTLKMLIVRFWETSLNFLFDHIARDRVKADNFVCPDNTCN